MLDAKGMLTELLNALVTGAREAVNLDTPEPEPEPEPEPLPEPSQPSVPFKPFKPSSGIWRITQSHGLWLHPMRAPGLPSRRHSARLAS